MNFSCSTIFSYRLRSIIVSHSLPNQKHIFMFSKSSPVGVCLTMAGVVIGISSPIVLTPDIYLKSFMNCLLEGCFLYFLDAMAVKILLLNFSFQPFKGSADGMTSFVEVQIHLVSGYWRIS